MNIALADINAATIVPYHTLSSTPTSIRFFGGIITATRRDVTRNGKRVRGLLVCPDGVVDPLATLSVDGLVVGAPSPRWIAYAMVRGDVVRVEMTRGLIRALQACQRQHGINLFDAAHGASVRVCTEGHGYRVALDLVAPVEVPADLPALDADDSETRVPYLARVLGVPVEALTATLKVGDEVVDTTTGEVLETTPAEPVNEPVVTPVSVVLQPEPVVVSVAVPRAKLVVEEVDEDLDRFDDEDVPEYRRKRYTVPTPAVEDHDPELARFA